MKKPLLYIVIAAILFLAACTNGLSGSFLSNGVNGYVSEQYPLIDAVKSGTNSEDTSRIYLAEGTGLNEVGEDLVTQEKPLDISERKDNKQILIYDQYFVTLTEDPNNEANTLIEVATNGFVRDNYNPDFFDGMIAMWILDDVLDIDDWGKKQKSRCQQSSGDCYEGFGSKGGSYKGPGKLPSFRGESQNIRGGGPGSGK